MNYDHLCMGCMRNKGEADPCPDCGWVEGSLPDSPAQLAPRTILAQKYLLGRVLGQGGFGITYLAWDMLLSRKLAIKEYFPREICSRARDLITVQALTQRSRDDFQYGLTKFVEEGQNLARFRDYPGIVSLLEFFEANGTAYIIMAYMEGMTFKQYLETQGGKINFEAALDILTPVMDALREVHRVGMLHRDISPDNIYINQDRQVKILDFGATRYALREQSHGLTVLFKPGYAPFEQYSSGGKQGAWTDVYAVGATFYRALTGKPPSEAPDRMAHDDLVLPSAMGIRVPVKSEPALLKALAVHWENRFQNIQDFQDAITPAQESDRVPQRATRAWLIAACLLLVSTLAFGGLWASAWKANQQLRVENGALAARLERADHRGNGTTDATTQRGIKNADFDSNKNRLSDSAKALAKMTSDRDALQSNNKELSASLLAAQQQISLLQKQVEDAKKGRPAIPSLPPSLTVAYLQLYEWDRLTNTRRGPATQFSAGGTRRILCAVGGPNPTQGRQAFSGQVFIAFINPSGGIKTRVALTIHTTPDQATWAAMAYVGSDQAGTLEKGRWRVEISTGSQILTSGSFTVG
jgi:serine/threonine protein kinase